MPTTTPSALALHAPPHVTLANISSHIAHYTHSHVITISAIEHSLITFLAPRVADAALQALSTKPGCSYAPSHHALTHHKLGSLAEAKALPPLFFYCLLYTRHSRTFLTAPFLIFVSSTCPSTFELCTIPRLYLLMWHVSWL
jgi:hypothetical protein